MAAPECVPLVMEPNSRFYTSPLLVLDFQSLYPSIVIAYNYCYSTCLGRISAELAAGKGGRLGVADYLPDPAFVAGLEASGELNVSPNGVMFCAPTVRTGILPRLLKEILDTRIMVKAALKAWVSFCCVRLRNQFKVGGKGWGGGVSANTPPPIFNAPQPSLALISFARRRSGRQRWGMPTPRRDLIA